MVNDASQLVVTLTSRPPAIGVGVARRRRSGRRRLAGRTAWCTPSSNVQSQRASAVTTTVEAEHVGSDSVVIDSGSPAAKIVGRFTSPPCAGWKDGAASGR